MASYWPGQVEDKICKLCREGEEDASHFWKCKALESARQEADKDIAGINPEDLPNPVKQGIAPALSASSCGTYWDQCERKAGATEK